MRESTPWPSTRRATATSHSRNQRYGDRFALVSGYSETVLQLMLSDDRDHVFDAIFELIETLTPDASARFPRSGHVLCWVFEEVAVALQTLINAPGQSIDALVGDEVRGSRILAVTVKALLREAVRIATQPATLQLTVLQLKACACALSFCPSPDEHTSLSLNCARPLILAGIHE